MFISDCLCCVILVKVPHLGLFYLNYISKYTHLCLSQLYYTSQRATFISILLVLYWLKFKYVYLSYIILVKVPHLSLFYLNYISKYTHLCLAQLYYTSQRILFIFITVLLH